MTVVKLFHRGRDRHRRSLPADLRDQLAGQPPCRRADVNWFRRLTRRRPPLEPVRPIVAPDPQSAAELERRMAGMDYVPQTAFHRDRQQERVELPMLLKRQAG